MPGPGEDRLDEHGAREHVREREAEDGDHDGRRGAQDVAQDHGALGQALRARGAHVVLGDDLEHRRARVAGEQADVDEASTSAGSIRCWSASQNVDHWPCEQRVDRVGAGRVGRRRTCPGRAGRRPGRVPSLKKKT